MLMQKRDKRTGEFLQTMLNGNFGAASEALKQPNFDPSNGANGVQRDWQPDGARNEPSIER